MENKVIKNSQFLIFIFLISAIGLFVWEGYQFLIDSLFGTSLFHDASQAILIDFWEDVIFGLAGVIMGSFYVKKLNDKLKAADFLNKWPKGGSPTI